jgi:hypothetical protein
LVELNLQRLFHGQQVITPRGVGTFHPPDRDANGWGFPLQSALTSQRVLRLVPLVKYDFLWLRRRRDPGRLSLSRRRLLYPVILHQSQ